jgi:hypothetical protein
MLLFRAVLCLGLIHTRYFINFDTGLFYSVAQVSSKLYLKILFIQKAICIFITKTKPSVLFKEIITLRSGNLHGITNICTKNAVF